MTTLPARDRIRAYLAVQPDATTSVLSTELEVTRSTAQRTLDSMVAAGELRVLDEKTSGGRGRRSRRYRLAARPRPVSVYVEAPEEVTVRVVESDGTILGGASVQRVSAGPLSTDDTLELFVAAAADAGFDVTDLAGAVVAVPGPVAALRSGDPIPSSRGGIATWGSNPPSIRQLQAWNGENPVGVLRGRLALDAMLANDGNLGALGEAVLGAGRAGHVVLGLTLVRTTGGGVVVDGRLRPGRSGMAGEIGHLSVRADGALCPCGNRGCFWAEAGYETLRLELCGVAGHDVRPADIADRVAADDPVFVAALRDFGSRVGMLISPAVSLLDPDVIVVDGALGAAAPVVADGLREAVLRSSSPLSARDLHVTPGTLQDTAPFVGGAVLYHRSRLSSARLTAASSR